MAKKWETKLTGLSLNVVRSGEFKNKRAEVVYNAQSGATAIGIVTFIDGMYVASMNHTGLCLPDARGVGRTLDEAILDWFDSSTLTAVNRCNGWRYSLLGCAYQAELTDADDKIQFVRDRLAKKGKKK